MMRAPIFALALAALASPVFADEVSDTLSSAMQAYEDGDIDYAIEELNYAKQLLQTMKAAALTDFLPEAPPGWEREVSQDMNAGLAMLGGGVGAEATYSRDGDEFTVTIMANNPMVAAFGGMIANAGMLGGKLVRVGREKFLNQDGELTGLIDNRILVQADGAEPDVMVPVLSQIDFKALKDFGG